MNLNFIATLMKELHFPKEAQAELEHAAAQLQIDADCSMQQANNFFYQHNFQWNETKEQFLTPTAEKTGIHPNTVDMVFLLDCSETLREMFRRKGMADSLFLVTMEDLRYKLMESWEVYGVWGTFVGFWYPVFFQMNLLKLGRLQYESCTYDQEVPYEKHGVSLKKGDPVKSIHIPSCGPLPEAACIDSYQQAYQFYKEELNGGPLVCVCHSWLLHPSTKAILPPHSNTVRFLSDFDIIAVGDSEHFENQWRVFGRDFEKPIDQLPEDTAMRRAYKKHLLENGKTGSGYGVLIFDGEKLLT